MKTIAQLLLAIYGTCKNIHYNGKGKDYYSQHLLGDRLIEELDPFDVIDHLQECTLLGSNKEFLNWKDIQNPNLVGDDLKYLLKLYDALQQKIESQDFNPGDESYWTGVYDIINKCKGFVYKSMGDKE